jgi:hypothetical protein
MNKAEHKPTIVIDTGHSTFKFAYKIFGKVPLPRAIATAIEKEKNQTADSDQTLQLGSERYVFGTAALAHLPIDATFQTSDAFIGSKKFYLLIRAILKILRPRTPVNVCIAIPDGMVRTRRAAIEQFLKSNEMFALDNSPLINDVLVVGQSFATSLAPDLRIKSKNALYVDVGHKTILLTLRQRSEIKFERSRSLEFGGGALIREIAGLYTESDSEKNRLSADLMQSLLQKGLCKYKGEIVEMNEATVARTSWVHDSITKILEVVSTVDDIDSVVLSGQSSRFLASEIKKLGNHLSVIEVTQPQFAVLRGLFVLVDLTGVKK